MFRIARAAIAHASGATTSRRIEADVRRRW
jgi:hypothetical protein